MSEERVQDTLLAEAGPHADMIELFRNGKAEHTGNSLATLFSVDEAAAVDRVRPLVELGFLEQIGSTYEVPILYRDGLNITQGKAAELALTSDE